MKLCAGLVALALASSVAAVTEWGQCGGKDYTGSTTCDSGLVCIVVNDYYFQCQKGTAAPTSTVPTSTITTSAPGPTNPPATTGFVKTSGQGFTLNGAKYTLVGANSYWVGLSSLSDSDIDKAFKDVASGGATTLRTWGFNEVTSPSGIYYQSWSGATPTINTGATGLGSFDNVIKFARSNNVRLIVALTNNWGDYGGMDVYVKQILGSANHDLFYTDAKVISAFKNYIKAFVTRYKSETAILGWELANEPRCKGSTGTSSGTCTPATITAWAKDISAYIKSLDTNHLVAIGDEGFFNEPSNPSYPYQGGEGIDFTANLKISTIDFGTFHAYPIPWGQSADPTGWGTKWITDHAAVQKSVGKPVIIEEFGVTDNQVSTYTAWYSAIESSGLTGDLIWQAGSHLSYGDTHNDGYAVYPDGAVYALAKKHNTALKARA